MAGIPDIHEQLVASRVILASAGGASAKLDAFSNWLMLSFAAAMGLLLDKGDRYLSGGALRYIIGLFLAVAILGIIGKYIAVMVSSASAGNAIGREAVADVSQPLDLSRLTARMLSGLPQPARLIAMWVFRKAIAGNFMGPPRFFLCLAQIQGLLTLAQAACLLRAIYVVGRCATFGG